jgi:lysylphosphatidylglycerol synthetase-like protein (DUF2156 family)
MLNDKSYFFTRNGQAVIPYVLSNNLAIALADPIGAIDQKPQAIYEFSDFCRKKDWEPVFYEVSDSLIYYYEEAGYAVFKIGEEARLRTEDFHLKGREFQNLRTVRNHARKRNIEFIWYDASQGIDSALEAQVAEVSRQWLEQKRALEMTFDMGSFSLEEIRRHGVAIALDSEGCALAFATWRSFAGGKGRALDIMRTLPAARNVMDFVLVESILRFRTLGVTEISLGNAPLANVEADSAALPAEGKVVKFLYENLNRTYGYKSLFNFKRKYRPQWQGRYVAYHRGAHLPLVGLALVRVHAPDSFWKFLWR